MRPLEVQRAVWVVTPLLFGPAVVYTQADTGAPASTELIAQARAQLHARQLDSAAVLLRRVTEAPARSPADRVQAWILLGIVNFYSASDSAASEAFRQAFSLDPGLDVPGLDAFDPEIARLVGEARAAVGVGDSTGPRTVAARAPVATLYDCLTKCADSVVPPQFVLFPYQMVLDGVVLPARRAHVFVALQAVVDQDGLVEPETVRLQSSTAVGVVEQIERALPQARFRPGFAKGVPVRTRVQLRFDFEAEGTGMIRYSYRVVGR